MESDSGLPAGASPSAGGGLAIEAESLVRHFGEVQALAGVSLAIRQGEFFSLLGPSGCGKTTLLRIIAGLELPDEGNLKICGRDAQGIPAHQRPVNTVFQSYALFPHLTVRDNVSFGLRMKKVGAAETKRRVDQALELVEIGSLAERRPAQLSGGQKQRVALARAVVNEPAVLLLDEPLGALDLKLRKQLQVELHQLQRRLGITFVYVTHDQDEALVMSDRIAVMRGGRLEQMDTAEALYERPRTRFVAEFLGSCNLIPASLDGLSSEGAAADTPLGKLCFNPGSRGAQLVPGGKFTLAIRPEKISLTNPGPMAEPNEVSALVEDLVYSGAETQYRLRVADFRFRAVALNSRPGHQGFEVGATVVCSFSSSALVVLDD